MLLGHGSLLGGAAACTYHAHGYDGLITYFLFQLNQATRVDDLVLW